MKSKFILCTSLTIAVLAGCASNNDPHTTHKTSAKDKYSLDELYIVESEGIDAKQEFVREINATKNQTKRVEKRELKRSASPQSMFLTQELQVAAEFDSTSDYVYPFISQESRENYASLDQSEIKSVKNAPVSTFSVDVDTGSYTNVRRMLNKGVLPPVNAVRVEEMINYFNYHYPAPDSLDHPFNIHTEIARSPWSSKHVLLKVGLKGYDIAQNDRKSANLVFLLDVSGSMNSPDKLPLLKSSLVLLSKQLSEKDRVSIVVYAGASGVVLEPTKGNETLKIEAALNSLSAGGSTNGHSGIEQAYHLAKQNFIEDGINRVILATDGDFNVGISDVERLKQLIETKRQDGITLTTLGFGTGNYNDHLMEQLANVGNGNYAYIDSFLEARKVLVEELSSTLMTIAKDVKIQIEFNPDVVGQYRLIGYENRALAREDFNNDRVDAGEIGAGHTVTAIYELVLQSDSQYLIDPLRYQSLEKGNLRTLELNKTNELAFIKFRYKAPQESKSKLLEYPIMNPVSITDFAQASEDFRFSASVANFGEALRNSKYVDVDYDSIINNAIQSKGSDTKGYRSEFIQLVKLASELSKG